MSDGVGNLPRGPARILKAAGWSWQGLRAAWRYESSFRLEVCLLLVLAMELANSAIEAVIARYGNEYHELAGRAKDMGSAAVLLLMLNVLACWGLILGPRLL